MEPHLKICLFTENYYKGGLDTFIVNLINAWPEPLDEWTLVCNGTHPGLNNISTMVKKPMKIVGYYRLLTTKLSQGKSASSLQSSYLVRIFFGICFKFLYLPLFFPVYIFSLTIYFWCSNFDRLMVINGGYPASLLCRSAIISWYLSGKRPLAVMNIHNFESKLCSQQR